jgi:hypothetical protein
MNEAIRYIKETLGLPELQYSCGPYSYGQKGNIRLIAEYNNRGIEVRQEEWYPEKSDEMKMVEIDNSQIAKIAFSKLYHEGKKDSALRLASSILSGDSIKLGIGDTDWEIEIAFNYCGAQLSAGRRYMATFRFKGITTIPEGHYESLIREFYD